MKRPVGFIVIMVSTLFAAMSLLMVNPASASTCSPNFFWDHSKPYGITNDQKTAQIFVDRQYHVGSWSVINGGSIRCGVIKTDRGTYTFFYKSFFDNFADNEFVQTVAVEVVGTSSQSGSPPPQRPTTAPVQPAPAPLTAPPVCPTPESSPPSDTSTATASPSPQASDTPTVGLVSLSANASQITSGARATIYGYVSDTSGCALPNSAVALMYQPSAGTEYLLQSLVTDENGRFSRDVAPPKQAAFRAVAQDVSSERFILNVSRRIAFSSPHANTRIPTRVTFSGRISPAAPGLYVGLARWSVDHWVYLTHAQTNGNGVWSTVVRLPRGNLTLKAYAPSNTGNLLGESIIRVVTS